MCKISEVSHRCSANFRYNDHQLDQQVTSRCYAKLRSQKWSELTRRVVISLRQDKMTPFCRQYFQIRFIIEEFSLKFHWNLFPIVQSIVCQDMLKWLGYQVTTHYLNQQWHIIHPKPLSNSLTQFKPHGFVQFYQCPDNRTRTHENKIVNFKPWMQCHILIQIYKKNYMIICDAISGTNNEKYQESKLIMNCHIMILVTHFSDSNLWSSFIKIFDELRLIDLLRSDKASIDKETAND